MLEKIQKGWKNQIKWDIIPTWVYTPTHLTIKAAVVFRHFLSFGLYSTFKWTHTHTHTHDPLPHAQSQQKNKETWIVLSNPWAKELEEVLRRIKELTRTPSVCCRASRLGQREQAEINVFSIASCAHWRQSLFFFVEECCQSMSK